MTQELYCKGTLTSFVYLSIIASAQNKLHISPIPQEKVDVYLLIPQEFVSGLIIAETKAMRNHLNQERAQNVLSSWWTLTNRMERKFALPRCFC